jgi:regulator of protease activity HflC (stomatin/prohibitin superfamily)
VRSSGANRFDLLGSPVTKVKCETIQVITRDNVTIKVTAVVYFYVVDPNQ